MELEYDNMMMTYTKSRSGQILGVMFSGRGTSMGVRMTKQVKALGTSSIKTLIESDKFIINDFQLIEEMSTFSRRGNFGWRRMVVMTTHDVSSHIWLVVKSAVF